MNKWLAPVLVLLLIAAAAFFSLALNWPEQKQTSQACFGESCFKVELVLTPSEWSRGLMNRSELPQDEGMLFVFDKEKESSFWMKNMLVPLDIIWLNQNQEVIFISKNNLPCGQDCPSITPVKMAKYVLEINSGLADKMRLAEDDKATLNINAR